ncbi:MAG TPA: VOC family protein [Acidimicrobiales bacterium]|nr:VOC family protein [Acidimicrobiales bacterium]
MPNVVGFDHLVLVVADVERTMAWYTDVLGLPPERLQEWRDGKVFFPSLRISPTSLIDVVPGERGDARNVDHFCLVVRDDVAELAASGRFDVVDGPDTRWGAQGDATSLYVRDPDGNVVELRRY